MAVNHVFTGSVVGTGFYGAGGGIRLYQPSEAPVDMVDTFTADVQTLASFFASIAPPSRSKVFFSDRLKPSQRGSAQLAVYSDHFLSAQMKDIRCLRSVVLDTLTGYEILATIMRDDRFSFDDRNHLADSYDNMLGAVANIVGRTFGVSSIPEPDRRLTTVQFKRIRAQLPSMLDSLDMLSTNFHTSQWHRLCTFTTRQVVPQYTYDIPISQLIVEGAPKTRLIQNFLARSKFAFGEYPHFTYWGLKGAIQAVVDLSFWEPETEYVIVKYKDKHVVMPEKNVPRHKRQSIFFVL